MHVCIYTYILAQQPEWSPQHPRLMFYLSCNGLDLWQRTFLDSSTKKWCVCPLSFCSLYNSFQIPSYVYDFALYMLRLSCRYLFWFLDLVSQPYYTNLQPSPLYSVDVIFFLALLRYNWNIILCTFKIYNVLILYMYILLNDYNNKVSLRINHLT